MCLSTVQLITEAVYTLRTARWDVVLLRKLRIPFVASVAIPLPFVPAQNIAMSGFSRDTRWLFNVRDIFVVVKTYTSARSVVSEQFFIDGLPTHNTGRQHQVNSPSKGGGKFWFEIWWKCTSKHAKKMLVCTFDGHILSQFKLCYFAWSRSLSTHLIVNMR